MEVAPPAEEIFSFIQGSWLNWLLVFIPISISIEMLGLPKIWLFATSALAIIPLAGLIGESTEQLAHRVGSGLGGLLNATLGNAPELIIGLLALRAGLYEVVKASIAGSIIGNVLLVLGLSMLVGGWRRGVQRFSRTHAGASASMLFLAVVALIMPALFDLTVLGSLRRTSPALEELSLLVAMVLIATYLASLVFSLRTHRELMTAVPPETAIPRLRFRSSLVLLLAATALTSVESELLVTAIQETTAALGMTEFFVGVVVVALVGNAAEHSTAVLMAKRDKMDLAVTIAVGSSTQIALFVAPLLVFASFLFGRPMPLVFNAFEIVGVGLAVVATSIVALDGESNWFEGVQLLAVYTVLAIVFFFVPGS